MLLTANLRAGWKKWTPEHPAAVASRSVMLQDGIVSAFLTKLSCCMEGENKLYVNVNRDHSSIQRRRFSLEVMARCSLTSPVPLPGVSTVNARDHAAQPFHLPLVEQVRTAAVMLATVQQGECWRMATGANVHGEAVHAHPTESCSQFIPARFPRRYALRITAAWAARFRIGSTGCICRKRLPSPRWC